MRRAVQWLRSGHGLPTFAALTLGWMILVILEGAVVRATGSGAGCGDHWPLCNGQILPYHPRLATIIEFTHRSMTGICSALTFALVAWTFFAQPRGSRVRRAALLSAFLLVTEALLGAVLVLGGFVERNASNLRVFVQAVHFTNTLLLLAALSLTWWWQKPRVSLRSQKGQLARRLAFWALASMVVTGATGSVAALADTLFPAASLRAGLAADFAANSPLLVRMRWMHPAASTLAFLSITALAWVCGRRGRLLFLLLVAQIVVGVLDVVTLAPITWQVLHLLAADLLWVALAIVSADQLFPHRSAAKLPDAAALRHAPQAA